MNRSDGLLLLKRLFAMTWVILIVAAILMGLGSTVEIHAGLLVGLGMLAYLASWGLAFGLRFDKHESLLIACGLCTLSVAFACFLIELPGTLGVVDYRVTFSTPAPAWKRPGNAPDRDLLFVREGNQTLLWRFQGNDLHRLKGMSGSKVYSNELKFDANGFRNRDEQRRSEIVLIGDSFLEAPHTADGQLISSRLAAITGRGVSNLGRSGYGPIQELIVLERFGLPLNPKEVVWTFYEGNDLADIREYNAARERLLNEKPSTPVSRCVGRSFTNNALEFLIRGWLRPEATRDPRLHLGHFETRDGEDLSIYFSSDDYNIASGPRANSQEFLQFGSILRTAGDLCREHSARLTLVFIPTKWRIFRSHCGFEGGSRCLAWGLDDLPREIETLKKSLPDGINFLDLTTALEQAAAAGDLVYLADDTHWSDQGHAIAALAVAESLYGKLVETKR